MEKLKEIASWFPLWHMQLYFVGGCVRDWELGLEPEDIDICVVGGGTAANVQERLEMLKTNGHIENLTSVHGKFPIWIVQVEGVKYEFAMARKERKVGQSHQDFLCEVNDVTIEQDLERRDLTINAIAKNVLSGEIIDPFKGRDDLKDRIARPVSEAFMEDDVRMIRAARFIAVFSLRASLDLCEYIRRMDPSTIANEMIGKELNKLFKKAKNPSIFFSFLKWMDLLETFFPELHACVGIPQNPEHHPEGDVFTHTMLCVDAAPQDPFMRAVMLCHDLGKAVTTTIDDIPWEEYITGPDKECVECKIKAKEHEAAGVPITRQLLQRICFTNHEEITRIACLVELHMTRIQMLESKRPERIIRRTLRRLTHYQLPYTTLADVIYYDLAGRHPKPAVSKTQVNVDMMTGKAEQLGKEMEPIVTGKKLIEAGLIPDERFGVIISHALELQDRGTLNKDNWKKVLKGAGHKEFKDFKDEG